MFEPKGYVITEKEFKHTMEPPEHMLGCDYNMKEEYFKALQGKMLRVMDIAVDGSSYLLLGDSPNTGQFIWDVDKRDTIGEMIPYTVIQQMRPSFSDIMKAAMKAQGLEVDVDASEIIDVASKAMGLDIRKLFESMGMRL
jgi:hypothetical protein